MSELRRHIGALNKPYLFDLASETAEKMNKISAEMENNDLSGYERSACLQRLEDLAYRANDITDIILFFDLNLHDFYNLFEAGSRAFRLVQTPGESNPFDEIGATYG